MPYIFLKYRMHIVFVNNKKIKDIKLLYFDQNIS